MKTSFWTLGGFYPNLLNHQGSLLQFKTFCRVSDISRTLMYLPVGDTCFFHLHPTWIIHKNCAAMEFLLKLLSCGQHHTNIILRPSTYRTISIIFVCVCFTYVCVWVMVLKLSQKPRQQECIPVGCVPSAAETVSVSDRGCLSRGVSARHIPPLPCEQNDRRCKKHYLAATTLQTVMTFLTAWQFFNYMTKKSKTVPQ